MLLVHDLWYSKYNKGGFIKTLTQFYESQEAAVLEAQKIVPLEWAERIRSGYDRSKKSLPLLERTKELMETKLGREINAEQFMLMVAMITGTCEPEFVEKCVELEMKENGNDLYGMAERVWYRVVRSICEDL